MGARVPGTPESRVATAPRSKNPPGENTPGESVVESRGKTAGKTRRRKARRDTETRGCREASRRGPGASQRKSRAMAGEWRATQQGAGKDPTERTGKGGTAAKEHDHS